MNPLIKNEEPQWIELGGGQRRKIRAYNENAMLVEVGFDTGAVARRTAIRTRRFLTCWTANLPIPSKETPVP